MTEKTTTRTEETSSDKAASVIMESRELQDGVKTEVTEVSVVPRIVGVDTPPLFLDDGTPLTAHPIPRSKRRRSDTSTNSVLSDTTIADTVSGEHSGATVHAPKRAERIEILSEEHLYKNSFTDRTLARQTFGILSPSATNTDETRLMKANVKYDVVVTVADAGLGTPRQFYKRFDSQVEAEEKQKRLGIHEGDTVTVKLDDEHSVTLERSTTLSRRAYVGQQLLRIPVLAAFFNFIVGTLLLATGSLFLGVANAFLGVINLLIARTMGDIERTTVHRMEHVQSDPDGVALDDVVETLGGVSVPSEAVTVHINDTEDAVVLEEVDGNRRWSASKSNGYVDEENIAFFEALGFENLTEQRVTLTAQKITDEETPSLRGANTEYDLVPE